MERVANAKIKQLENRVNQLVAQLANVKAKCEFLKTDLQKLDPVTAHAVFVDVQEIIDYCGTPEKVKI